MFRKILLILFCLLFLSSPVMGTDYFMVDTNDCANHGDGTAGTCAGAPAGAGAFNVIDATTLSAIGTGDQLWIRRTYNDTYGADINITADGTAAAPAYWIGWPRAADSWDCDWVNGSTTVDNIDENDATRGTHQGRWITGPDGFDYLITDITDGNTVIIDRPYAGSTTANEVVAIKADELPRGVTQPGDPDNWDADADDLPKIDFNGGSFQFRANVSHYTQFWNMEVTGSTDWGVIRVDGAHGVVISGCLFDQTASNPVLSIGTNSSVEINRTIIEGNSTGAAQSGIDCNKSQLGLTNSAIYNMGSNGLTSEVGADVYLENVNIGVEAANDSADLTFNYDPVAATIYGRDVKLGGTNGEFSKPTSYFNKRTKVTLVNYNKVLGAWKMYYYGGAAEKVAVTGVTPNKKLSDDVIEITPDTANTYQFIEIEQKVQVFESRKTYDAGTYNIKLWIYNDTGNTLNDTTFSDDIMMRCRAEAGNYGDATTEYVSMPWTYSDEIDILDAADADDWDYLQCDSVVVDQASKIYCEVLISTYDAGADNIYIDPQTVNP